ncbi:MAG: TRAP transporter large permease subunit [Gammaproteobacteria bacterium]|nr:MAG: TRAP transporter large permease subunit [Gammaproteobacteria bacterium]
MILLLALLLLIALLGLPLFAALGGAALVLVRHMDMDPAVLVIELNRLASSPNLIAIPLFTFAGVVMAAGGAPQRLVRLFYAVLGRMPGGIASVALGACAFFTAFSGASGITILALGGLLYPILEKCGYPERFSLGLLTTSGSIGLLFPPSLAVLVYGIVAGVNIDRLFLAGLIPGTLLMLLLVAFNSARARRLMLPRRSCTLEEFRRALLHGATELAMPPLILLGIFGGFVTVTEAAACTVVYVLVVEALIFRTIRLREQLIPLMRETCILVGSILVILGVAMGLINLLIDAQVPDRLLAWVEGHVGSRALFLLILNLTLLAVGAIMDIFSAIVVVVPLLLPLAARYGVDPFHLGVVMLANLEIGYNTPPVGINLFIASQRFGQPVFRLFRATLPFLAVMLAWLGLVTWIPFLSLWWK